MGRESENCCDGTPLTISETCYCRSAWLNSTCPLYDADSPYNSGAEATIYPGGGTTWPTLLNPTGSSCPILLDPMEMTVYIATLAKTGSTLLIALKVFQASL